MKLDDLKFKDVLELRQQMADLFGVAPVAQATESSRPKPEHHGIKLVIADRGFVYVGDVTTDAEWCHIQKALNIRYWGTTKGLGELANGPLSGTKLDKTGNVKIAMRAIIGMIDVEESKWLSAF